MFPSETLQNIQLLKAPFIFTHECIDTAADRVPLAIDFRSMLVPMEDNIGPRKAPAREVGRLWPGLLPSQVERRRTACFVPIRNFSGSELWLSIVHGFGGYCARHVLLIEEDLLVQLLVQVSYWVRDQAVIDCRKHVRILEKPCSQVSTQVRRAA